MQKEGKISPKAGREKSFRRTAGKKNKKERGSPTGANLVLVF